MGNCFSTSAKKDANPPKDHDATRASVSREKELAQALEELEASKQQANAAENETFVLRDQLNQLQAQHATSEQNEQARCANLESALGNRLEEITAQKRVSAAYMLERNDARNLATKLEEKIKDLEEGRELLTKELLTVKSDAADDLADAKAQAEKEISSVKNTLASTTEELATMRKQLESNRVNLDNANEDLTSLRCQRDKLISQNEVLNNDLENSERELKLELRENQNLKATVADFALLRKELDILQQKHDAVREEYRLLKSNSKSSDRMTPNSFASAARTNNFETHVRFSQSKDIRVRVGEWDRETRVDIREFYGGPSKKGLSLPVIDADALLQVLPDVLREAFARERG